MKTLIKLLIIADILALVFLIIQLIDIAKNYNSIQLYSDKLQAILMFPIAAVILVGIIGMIRFKKWAFIVYYIQFPFRLYLWVFSIGFITFIPEIFKMNYENLGPMLFKICFIVEFIRLYFTIKAQLYFSQVSLGLEID